MPSLVLEATWAAAGGTVIIYLAALTSVAAGALRRGRGRRRRALAQALERHPAAAARDPVHHADPADHRHRAGLPAAVPVHRRRAGELDHDDPAPDLPVRLHEQPRRRVRQGHRAEPHARDLPRRPLDRVLPRHRADGATIDDLGFRPRCRQRGLLAGRAGSAPRETAEADRGIVSKSDWGRPGIRIAGTIVNIAAGHRARRDRPAAAALAAQVGGHPDAGDPDASARAVPHRVGVVEHREGVERRAGREVLLQHRRGGRRARGRCSSSWPPRAGYALSVLRPKYGQDRRRRSCWRRCSSRPSCCWCRST